MLLTLANPHRFMTLSAPMVPAALAAGAVLLTIGLPMALMAPPDYRQGDAARIMFIHVPAAWTSMAAYAALAATSLAFLIFRSPLSDIAAAAIAPPGALMTLICLITGSIWGKPVWNTWWEWDGRLTSVLALFFIYLAYMALRSAHARSLAGGAAPSAIFAVVGAVNLPVIKFSVDWWNTLHQPASILRSNGPAMPPDYLLPLAVMSLGIACILTGAVLAAMRAEILFRKANTLMLHRVDP